MGAILGPNKDGKYERKVRQIGEVYYNPPNEGEMMRHLKVLIHLFLEITKYCDKLTQFIVNNGRKDGIP